MVNAAVLLLRDNLNYVNPRLDATSARTNAGQPSAQSDLTFSH